eukprot:Selendium_serpulae@DN4115_c0_g1_i1.p1
MTWPRSRPNFGASCTGSGSCSIDPNRAPLRALKFDTPSTDYAVTDVGVCNTAIKQLKAQPAQPQNTSRIYCSKLQQQSKPNANSDNYHILVDVTSQFAVGQLTLSRTSSDWPECPVMLILRLEALENITIESEKAYISSYLNNPNQFYTPFWTRHSRRGKFSTGSNNPSGHVAFPMNHGIDNSNNHAIVVEIPRTFLHDSSWSMKIAWVERF